MRPKGGTVAEGRGEETQGTRIQGARIQGARVAALLEEGFEQVELTGPMEILKNAGATVDIVSPHRDKVRSWHHGDWNVEFRVDVPLRAASPDDYDALLIPGGVRNPDRLRRNPDVWRFVKDFFVHAKPVAAICHAPWVLIDSDVIDGRRLTSYPSLQMDLRNAGAQWVDEEVVVDRGLITSRDPGDIPAFGQALTAEIARTRQPPAVGAK
jgi:protease I